ncbi:MAG: hypothetical protein ABJ308_06545 [Halieaceae bacterium]
MESGRRTGIAPIPTDLDEYLNDMQVSGLRQVEKIGWQLKFIRRPVFEAPVVVLAWRSGKRLALLEQNGRLNERANIHDRNDDKYSPPKYLV